MDTKPFYSITAAALIILAFCYALIRADSVFYVHDELVSKWAYMIDWNFLPYQGYFDANNHLLNSLLGGAFIRLFKTDHILIVRLPNLIGLLIYAFTALRLKKHFRSPLAHLSVLAALLFSPYLIEFFGLARGYGLSWAFLLFAISLQMDYFRHSNPWTLLLCGLSLLLASYANLALISLSAFGLILLLIKAIKKPIQMILLLPFIGGLIYLIDYTFELQAGGKLYLGEDDGFLNATILPLLELNFNTAHLLLLSIILFISIFLLLWLPFKLLQKKSLLPDYQLIPHSFFLVAIVSMFLLHALFDVKFPMHRAAAHLIMLFTLTLFYTLDQMQLDKGAALLSILFLINFGIQANFSYAKEWSYEHFDPELLEKIPEYEGGIPPTTGGRFWQIDNELARVNDYPIRALQDMSSMKDSLQEYIVVLPELNPQVYQTHQLIHQDSISGLSLFKRKRTLTKVLDSAFQLSMNLTSEEAFFDIYEISRSGPLIIQTQGRFEDLDIYRNFQLIFAASEIDSDEKIQYGGFSPISSTKINEDGSIDFDFSYLIEGREKPYLLNYYVWKQDSRPLSGALQLKVFKIE
jgi:hypothetical protein